MTQLNLRFLFLTYFLIFLNSTIKLNCLSVPELNSTFRQVNLSETIQTKQCPSGWIINSELEKCFLFNLTKASFADNYNWCIQMNSTMVSIHNKEENEFIRMLLNDNSNSSDLIQVAWLGAYFYHKQFLWLDGSTVDYINWNKQTQSKCLDKNEICLIYFRSSGSWFDTDDVYEKDKKNEKKEYVKENSENYYQNMNVNLINKASQICQIDLKSSSTSLLKEKLKREYQFSSLNSTINLALIEIKHKLIAINESYQFLKDVLLQLNSTLRKEIYLRIKDHEKVKILLSNYTNHLTSEINLVDHSNQELSNSFKTFSTVFIIAFIALILINFFVLRSYIKIKRTYIHPNAITNLLEFNQANNVN